MYFISLSDINSDVIPEVKLSESPEVPGSKISPWITASVADTATVNPNSIKGLLSLTRNPSDLIILDSRVFDNFTVTNKLFAEAYQRLESYQSTVNYAEN